MINVSSIDFSLKNKKILKNITLSADEKNLTAIIGPNGSGKSTLIKVLRRLYKKESGSININDKNLEDFTNKELSFLMSYLPQTTRAVPSLVQDCILLGRKPHINILPQKEDIEKTKQIIKKLNLEKLSEKNILDLSGGELQKVLIARSLVQESKILFLDEPINHLDIKNQIEIMELIKKIVDEDNLLTFVVLHDLNLAFKYAKNILLLKDGKVRFYGKKSDLNENILSDAYNIKIKIITFENEMKIIY